MHGKYYEEPILVLGAARSGTSMVAGLLHRMGAWVGETVRGAPENPKGFFENKRIRDGVMKTMLATAGYDVHGRDPIPEQVLNTEMNVERFRYLIGKCLEHDGFLNNIPWLYKDCKLALNWDIWNESYPNAKWVFVKRNKEDIIESIMQTPFMHFNSKPGERDEAYWDKWIERYYQGIEELKEAGVHWYELSSDSIISGNFKGIETICEDTYLRFDEEQARQFVDTKLWKRDRSKIYETVKNEEGQSRLKLDMGMNQGHGEILENIRTNIRRHLPQVKPFRPNNQRIALIGGGPSLEQTRDELDRCVDDGCKLVAMNGTYQWLIDNGYRPSAMVMVDSRPFNAKFITKPVKGCKYFIASQCHPDVFDKLEGVPDVFIWHAVNNIGEEQILEDYYYKRFIFIIGGSTVMLRSIWLMRTLGFKQIDVFGFDSCYMDDQHHAYEQPENDGCEIREVTCMGKKFKCAAWMASQFDDFQHFIASAGSHFELSVHGEGLIAHMMKEGAKLFDEQQREKAIGGN
jgi:uncharacterized Rossmann fold enzyme